MSGRKAGFACFVLVAALIGAGWRLGADHLTQARQSGGLVVAPQHLDLGEVWATDDLLVMLPIENPGYDDVRVLRTNVSCRCTKIEPESFIVPAGGRREVAFHMDLTPPPAEMHLASREFVVSFGVVIDGDIAPQAGWMLRGTARQAVAVEPAVVDFGDALYHGSPFPPRDAIVTALLPIAELRAECNRAQAEVDLEPVAGQEHQYRLRVAPRAGLTVGVHEFPIRLIGRMADESEPPLLDVRVRARVQEDVTATPRHVVLSALGDEPWAEETVVLSSHAGRAFAVEGITCDLAQAEFEQAADADGVLIRLRRPADDAATEHGRLAIVVRRVEQGDSFEIPVAVTYVGRAKVQ